MGEPNAEDGLVADITEQYKTNYDQWFRVATQITLKEATDEKLGRIEEAYLNSLQPSTTNTNSNVSNGRSPVRFRRNNGEFRARNITSKLASRPSSVGKENRINSTKGPNTMDTDDEVQLSGTKRKGFAHDDYSSRDTSGRKMIRRNN